MKIYYVQEFNTESDHRTVDCSDPYWSEQFYIFWQHIMSIMNWLLVKNHMSVRMIRNGISSGELFVFYNLTTTYEHQVNVFDMNHCMLLFRFLAYNSDCEHIKVCERITNHSQCIDLKQEQDLWLFGKGF